MKNLTISVDAETKRDLQYSRQSFVAPSHLLLTLDTYSMEAEHAALKMLRELDPERMYAALNTLCGVDTLSLDLLAQQSNAAALATINKFIVSTSRTCCSAEIQELMQRMYERFNFLPVLLGLAGPVLHQLQQQPILQQTAGKLGVVSNSCEALALALLMSAGMAVGEAAEEKIALKQQLVRRIEAAGATPPVGCIMTAHFSPSFSL
jgi:hypothetical protein